MAATHRGAEIVSDLMGESDVGHFRGNVAAVVLNGDDAGVKRLPLTI